MNDIINGKSWTYKGRSKYTQQQVEEMLKTEGYSLISEYKNTNDRIKFLCPFGHESYAKFSHFLKGHRCDRCRRDKDKVPQEVVFNYIKSFKYIVLSTKYINCKSKIEVICPNNHKTYVRWTEFKRGQRCKFCYKQYRRGENHPNWNQDRTTEERTKSRKGIQTKNWRNQIFLRDNYTCQKCNRHGIILNIHHLNGYHWDELNRYNINNGITLCEKCHREFHRLYGTGHNKSRKASIIEYNLWNPNKIVNYPELFQLNFRFGIY